MDKDFLLKAETRLLGNIEKLDYEGYDPFDGMNSPVLKALSLHKRLPGIALLQLMKRSPINFRPLLLTKKGRNPKGIGLMVSYYCGMSKRDNNPEHLKKAEQLATWLIKNASSGYSGLAWGYNFDWPNRNAWFEKGLPTVVNSSYIGNALLDLYESTNKDKYLDAAVSVCKFMLQDINRTTDKNRFCFSYTPSDMTCIHNANMLASAFIMRTGAISDNSMFRNEALSSMTFSVAEQKNDGAWLYGIGKKQEWIDSFHTGYNLLALNDFINYSGNNSFSDNLKKGFDYYISSFFSNGYVKYYHNKEYPYDCHAFAHAIITLQTLAFLDRKAGSILESTVNRTFEVFYNARTGMFSYLHAPPFKIHIEYMRWVQIWMLYALGKYNGKNMD